MSVLETQIVLPPGAVKEPVVRALVELFFGENPVFRAKKFGRIDGDERLSGESTVETLVRFCLEHQRLTVTGTPASNYLLFMPNREGEASWTGKIVWSVPARAANEKWKLRHAEVVARVMELVNSPIAYSGLEEDLQAKCWRWVEEAGGGERKIPTLSSVKAGIPAMFWRLFLAKRVSDAIPALKDIPLGERKQQINSVVMLSPYSDPDQANTPPGKASEQALIDVIGRERFYNPETHEQPAQPLLRD